MWTLLFLAVPLSSAENLADQLAKKKATPPMDWYARAYLGYGAVSVALEHPEEQVIETLIDTLIDDMRARPMVSTFKAGSVTVDGVTGSASAAWQGHLALLLEGRQRLGPTRHASFSEALLDSLAEDVLARSNHLLPTYGKRTWPADNEVIWAALALGAQREARPSWIEAAAAMQAALHSLEQQQLPPSEVHPDSLRSKDVPRGCALAWTVAIRGLHRPDEATALYRRFKAAYWQGWGPVVGFREWPKGVDRSADSDSGPIVLGIGTAASAFGIGATRLIGAQADHRALLASARLAGLQEQKRPIARAIHFWAQHATSWTSKTEALRVQN